MTVADYVPGSVKSFSCPNCGGTIGIRAVGVTVTAVCSNCGSTIDVADPQLRIIQRASERARSDLLLPLGSRGTLFDDEWEVVGFMERAADSGRYTWSEYLLFNPWQGFRFLVEDHGHWNFVKMLRRGFDGKQGNILFEGRSYKPFNVGDAEGVYVLGEFYWRVKVGETAATKDYIAPPFMLSREESGQDVMWSLATYIAPDLVRSAFRITAPWRAPAGVAANQPRSTGPWLLNLFGVSAAALFVLFMTQVVMNDLVGKQILVDGTIQATAAQKDTPAVTKEFEIPGRSGNLEVKVAAPVQNDWIEVQAELVNQATQAKDEVNATVEFYSGRDSDGEWSEGSQVARDILSGVPGGKYRLFLTLDAGAFSSKNGQVDVAAERPVSYRVTVTRNVEMWGNFVLAAALLLAWIPVVLLYIWWFEQRRWSQSSIGQSED
jgi:hypothetical protein